MKIIHLCTYCTFFSLNAQVLHHQTISSQGSSNLTQTGFVVGQSIGQSSPSGTFSNSDLLVQQGFQQYATKKFDISSTGIKTKIYPNPFVSVLNFEFSQSIGIVHVFLYDFGGKLVKRISGTPRNNVFTFNFQDVADGSYIVILSDDDKYKYSQVIFKKNK
jgi:hypothetical protein